MNTVPIDWVVCASDEAKICLNCDRVSCTPSGCLRLKQMKDELIQEKLHRSEKSESEANFQNARIK